jgi:O-antigen/teichoic acid export membrane protein
MDIKRKIISGLTWVILSRSSSLVINFIIIAVLARMLSPYEFGIVGMILVFTDFAILFNSIGLGQALVQKKDIDEQHLSSVFWVNFLLGIILCLVFILISPLLAKFYNEPKLKSLIILTSFNFIILSVKTVQRAILLKRMEFKKIARIDITSEIIAGIVGILFAYSGFGAFSLVIRTLVLSFFIVIQLWIVSSWLPKLYFSFIKIKDLFKFGANLTGSNILNYWVKNIDNLLIGKFLGSISLGIYTKAYGLMMLPIRQISNVTSQVMFPAFSNYNEDILQVQRMFLKTLKIIALLSMPLIVTLIVLAEQIIYIVYGSKWGEIVPIIRVLALSGMLWTLSLTFRWVYMSQGRSDIMFRWNIIEGIVLIISIVIGLHWNLIGIAVSITISNYLFLWFPSWHIPAKLIKLNFFDIVKVIYPFFIFSLLMFLFEIILLRYLFYNLNFILQLIFVSSLGLGFYFALLVKFHRETIFEIFKIIKEKMSKGK